MWDGHVRSAIFKMDNQPSPTAEHRELCLMLCGSLDGRGVWRRMDTCMCMTESLCCPPETTTTFLKFLQERNRTSGIPFKAIRVTISRTKTDYKPSKPFEEDSGRKETS